MAKQVTQYAPSESLGYLVRATNRAFQLGLQERLAAFDIKVGAWYFLRALWIEDGLTQKALSDRANVLESTAVPALNAMEKQGLIRRRRSQQDRRKIHVHLTAKGKRLEAKVMPSAQQVNKQASKHLSGADLATFKRVARQLATNLDREGWTP